MVNKLIPSNLNSSIWVLCIAVLINRSTGFLTLFAAIFFGNSGMSPANVSLALAATGIGGVLGSIVSGKLTDLWGIKKILILSSLLNAPILYALSFSNDTALIIALSGLSVFFSQAFIPPASTLIAKSAIGEERVTLFAFFRIFINVGSIISPAIAGFLGENSFPTLFKISCFFSAFTALILLLLNETGANQSSNPKRNDNLQRIDIPLLLLLISMSGTMLIYAQHQGAVPIEMQTRENGMRIFATLLLINPILVVLIEYPLSHITKKIKWNTALSLGVVIMATGIMITGWIPILFFSYLGWLLFTVGECLFAPMSNTAVAEISTEQAIGRNQGLLGAWQSVGMALGPAAGSSLFALCGGFIWPLLFMFSIVCIALIYISKNIFSKSKR